MTKQYEQTAVFVTDSFLFFSSKIKTRGSIYYLQKETDSL